MNLSSSTSWSLQLLILHVLLVLLIAQGNSERKIPIANKDVDEEHILQPSSSSSNKNDDLDPSFKVFFNPEDLMLGKQMPIYFPKRDPSASPKLLSKQESDSIPFSTSNLSYLLDFFSFPHDSSQAKSIEYTLAQCELKPLKGEDSFCATSLESMIDFVTTLFGSGTKLKVLTTSPLSNTAKLLQIYTILETPEEIVAPRMMGCHAMPYPYAVFYCHSQTSETRLYQVSLGGEDGKRICAAAMCHMDTAEWDKSHAAFKVLKVEPGASPVCHFFPSDSLVWVPLQA